MPLYAIAANIYDRALLNSRNRQLKQTRVSLAQLCPELHAMRVSINMGRRSGAYGIMTTLEYHFYFITRRFKLIVEIVLRARHFVVSSHNNLKNRY
jgi:hypothetical protein